MEVATLEKFHLRGGGGSRSWGPRGGDFFPSSRGWNWPWMTLCFIPEQLNTWGSPILQENALQMLNSLQYDHLLQCNCAINFDDFTILAMDCSKFKLLLRESFNRMWQTYFKQDDKIVSIGTLWLRWQFYFRYHMIVRFGFNI